MKVTSKQEAWNEAAKIFPTDYAKDDARSANAGYPIYHSTADGVNAWISDLGDRLEVNLPNGKSVNIWIEEPKPAAKVRTGAAQVTHYQSCTWSKNGLRPDELKKMAQKIFEGGKITNVYHHSYGTNNPEQTHGEDWATVLTGTAAYTVECEGIPVIYVIHMDGFDVTEIIEEIFH